jgi:hydrogenase nickel incorporation protein HypB
MGSIGAGKTALIIKIAEVLRMNGKRVAAVAGDVTGEDDFKRMHDAGIKAVNCNTGHECHLDANMIRKAMGKIDLHDLDVLIIENVGNLVCPADFPLGTGKRAVVISVTEGDDMVRKHPHIFQHADVAILNKVDIAEHVDADIGRIRDDYRKLTGGNKELIECSVRTGAGLDRVIKALGLL